ncbi:MAG: RAD55 family ATPase, partial [Candidatus Poseidoniia archaeon]
MAEIISTGIERLDEALIDGKGIVMGTSMLIVGSAGSGKELLAKQYASAGIGSENVVYFSTDETSDELIDTFEQYNWPTDFRIVNVGTQY